MKSSHIILFFVIISIALVGCVSTDLSKDVNQTVDQNTDSNTLANLPEQYFCEQDSDCVKTEGIKGCCGCQDGAPEFAVNEKWFAAQKPAVCGASTACTASYHCTDRVAKCVENKCTLVEKIMPIDELAQIIQTFQYGETVFLQDEVVYQSEAGDIRLTNVSVYEFYCPPGVPCAYRPDNVSFTIQLMEGDQVKSSQEIVLTQDGLTGQSILTKEWGSITVTLRQIRDRTATIIITKTA